MAKEITLNMEQKLYVIPAGDGYSCRGFDSARDWTIHLADLMGLKHTLPDPLPYGTIEAYLLYRAWVDKFSQHSASTQTCFDPGTPSAVQRILENARVHSTRLRLYFGDADTGLDWNEEFEVEGYIGRSMGPIKAPLLIKTSRSSGGPAISTGSIVKIEESRGRRVLYVHPSYHTKPFWIHTLAGNETVKVGRKERKLPVEIYSGDSIHARFETLAQAEKWALKMGVKLHSKKPEVANVG